ncbi:MAG: hypothetical protein DI569_13425 [Sphingopyxis macrogoltabida]|uniref:DUF1003 domain-containing protein n=1 Tax=Sphingopyxis macrogoltabida TaxID=33050 RepID=A0A2W5L2M3_SPHMC|nr:MAG: hypothetical protein DI569_13425 [Sphingopyxis macrogoltabida]
MGAWRARLYGRGHLALGGLARVAQDDAHLTDLSLRLLGRAYDQLDAEECRVIRAIAERAPSSRDAADLEDARARFGDRLADRVAAVGGSWGFIIAFSVVLFGWMLLNSEILARFGLAFDPYPFIFLNLMLSTLAAVQAPIIMMSQNRQAAKDRLSASVDYEINLRAELEIMRLHHKLDELSGEVRAVREKMS